MKKDITQFVSRKSHEENLIARFTDLVRKTKTKKEIRMLEMSLLRPKPIGKYKGQLPGKSLHAKRSIKLTFPSQQHIKIWAELFKVNTYVENNTYDIDFLIELFRLMKDGKVLWDKDKKRFIFPISKSKRQIKRRKR